MCTEDDDTLGLVLFEESGPKISQEGGETIWELCDGGILKGGGAVGEEKCRDIVGGAGEVVHERPVVMLQQSGRVLRCDSLRHKLGKATGAAEP